jgi:hypothetical protein
MKRNIPALRRESRGAAWRARRRRDWRNVCCTFCLKGSHLKGRFGRSETFRCTARNKALKDQAEGY